MEKTGPFLKILERLGGESRIHYSLDHFVQALEAAGSPHQSVKTIVIAGTNGKGSVSLLVSSALMAAGKQVGTFLSPHLQHPRERILHNLTPLSEASLDALAPKWEALADKYELTYFEFLTLLCFVWAKDAGLDYLVLEVGMGGRLDSTNVTTPVATAITSIDFDHQAYLGNTLEAILTEKMGILREGVPVFTHVRGESLQAVLEKRATELKAPVHYAWKHPAMVTQVEWSGQTVELAGTPFRLATPTPGMAQNAAVAYDLARYLLPELPIDPLQKAFARVRNPGRMEVVQENPRIVLSGDHNPAGIQTLVETLGLLKCKPRVICAFAPDKPHAEMLKALQAVASDVILTRIARFEGKMPAGYESLTFFIPDPAACVTHATRYMSPKETLLITGSLYLVGELRPRWKPEVRFLAN
jgi:dihydrofolate synthase / folylpolyglutamate synthase